MSKKKSELASGLKDLPNIEQLKAELNRERYRKRYNRVLRSTIYALIVVAAAAVLVSMLYMPVLQIYGSSMSPTLEEGDIVLALKGTEYETGDMVTFYLGNKILVKRYIAGAGQWVNLDEEGNVYVNGQYMEEPYIIEKALGECNIELPYQVPESRYFVMGDHRATSADSRNTAVGCVSDEQMIGEIFFRVWPLEKFGRI